MIKFIVLTALCLYSLISDAQHTIKYNDLLKDLKLIEKIPDTVYYRNSKIKRVGTISKYKYKGIEYTFYSGKSLEYYRNGNISIDELLDNYGNYLKAKFYDRKGRLWEEWNTTKISPNTSTLDEYLKSEKSNFKRTIIHYNYSSKYKKWYVFRKDNLELYNDKKFETRIFLSSIGDTLRTKEIKYKNR
jgi:hypothetical protein